MRPADKRDMPLPQEIIHRKREGFALQSLEIEQFVEAIADGRVSDAQIAAFTMAVCCRGMDSRECVALTRSLRDSGSTLDWRSEALGGPVLDKHSTGGVGDTVSLVLAPLLAACGAYVPMISGRGLGHTGGTLDKLESIPGYQVQPALARFRACVREAGVAIVGASAELAPADRRIYAVRDVCDTVDSIPLITASILSKKLAAGLDALVLDVKCGSGAQTPALSESHALARTLVGVAAQAGLTCSALVTDMGQPLAPAVGNACEVRLALRYLRGDERPARLHAVTLALGAEALLLGKLASDHDDAKRRLCAALDSGAAAERFARMVRMLGGPTDLFDDAAGYLPQAPHVAPLRAARAGVVAGFDTRAVGFAVVELGGGHAADGAPIDPRVGLEEVVAVGTRVERGDPLALVLSHDADAHARAVARLADAIRIDDADAFLAPLIHERVGAVAHEVEPA
jgi:thymidine phosphorylase